MREISGVFYTKNKQNIVPYEFLVVLWDSLNTKIDITVYH